MVKNIRLIIQVIILNVALFQGGYAWASVKASGTMTAEQPCAAYVSKNKRTNPGDIRIEPGKIYQVFEVNRKNQPDWYRIRLPGVSQAERWVAKQCGMVDVRIDNGGGGSGGGGKLPVCRSAGLEENYKLALSWQPAFCETHQDKPECRIDDVAAYQARNFVLHGLWPNKKACGIDYGYCGEIGSKPSSFCQYPELDLAVAVREELAQVMPSVRAGSCLQRHEWYKHGTCQTKWSMDEYFDQSSDLTRQFNESGVGYFMSRHIGKTVNQENFLRKVDCALGEGASQRLQLKCKNGQLVDVYINLPADLGPDENLGDLMRRAAAGFSSNCGEKFTIDPIGLGQ